MYEMILLTYLVAIIGGIIGMMLRGIFGGKRDVPFK